MAQNDDSMFSIIIWLVSWPRKSYWIKFPNSIYLKGPFTRHFSCIFLKDEPGTQLLCSQGNKLKIHWLLFMPQIRRFHEVIIQEHFKGPNTRWSICHTVIYSRYNWNQNSVSKYENVHIITLAKYFTFENVPYDERCFYGMIKHL